MDDQSPWDDALKKAENEFSLTQAAMDAKERIFTNVMKTISSNPMGETAFQDSLKYVEQLSESERVFTEGPQPYMSASNNRGKGEPLTMAEVSSATQAPIRKRRPNQPTRKSEKRPIKISRFLAGAGAIAAAAAVIVTVGLNREPKIQPVNYETLDPIATKAAIEKLPIYEQSHYVTIAANKHFQLGYLEGETKDDVIQVVVSANTADIDWDTFYATNQNNDLIEPLKIDKETNIVTLLPTQSEIQLEISDCDGNLIECTLADNL